MAYELKLTRRAYRQLQDILSSVGQADKEDFQEALRQLETNPYPTSQNLPRDAIRRISIRGRGFWRFKVNRRYRIIYEVHGFVVTIRRVVHRREAYRDL